MKARKARPLTITVPAGSEAIEEAKRFYAGGKCFAFPTDTVYGLGCDPRNRDGVLRIFELKRREQKPLPILCASYSQASSMVQLNEKAETLAKKFWPGPLTIVAPQKDPAIRKEVSLGSRLIGVRVPNHSFCLELIRKLKAPLVGTSANISGEPSARSTREVAAYFGKRLGLIIDGGTCPTTARESTVVAVEDRNVILIREGSISDEIILLAKE